MAVLELSAFYMNYIILLISIPEIKLYNRIRLNINSKPCQIELNPQSHGTT